MAATKTDAPNAPSVLNFAAIDARAKELGIESLHDHLDVERQTVWRWRNGLVQPTFEMVKHVADELGLTIDEVRAKGNPTPKPPPAPSTPKPPAGPKPTAVQP